MLMYSPSLKLRATHGFVRRAPASRVYSQGGIFPRYKMRIQDPFRPGGRIFFSTLAIYSRIARVRRSLGPQTASLAVRGACEAPAALPQGENDAESHNRVAQVARNRGLQEAFAHWAGRRTSKSSPNLPWYLSGSPQFGCFRRSLPTRAFDQKLCFDITAMVVPVDSVESPETEWPELVRMERPSCRACDRQFRGES